MSELERLRQDLARARQRVALIERGERGVRPPDDWRGEVDGLPAAGLAYNAQLQAQRQAVDRLELEYVHAMLPKWGASAVIAAMEGK